MKKTTTMSPRIGPVDDIDFARFSFSLFGWILAFITRQGVGAQLKLNKETGEAVFLLFRIKTSGLDWAPTKHDSSGNLLYLRLWHFYTR